MSMSGFKFGTYSNERQFHLKTLPEDVGGYVLLVGDPARADISAKQA